jgi:branched-chain amino acid transport system substrate-binding protein
MHSVAAALRKAGTTETEKLVAAMQGLPVETPFGRILYRTIDHQSTMGAYVGRLSKKDGKGVMTDWVYRDGAAFLPPDESVKRLRPAE